MDVENGMVIPSKSIQKDQNNLDFIFVAKEKGAKDGKTNYVVEKVIVTIIERFEGETLIETNSKLKDLNVVVDGSRGIADKDTVRVQ
jgi:hypothetical protein